MPRLCIIISTLCSCCWHCLLRHLLPTRFPQNQPLHFRSLGCSRMWTNPTFHEEVKTNEHGEFRVHLPFSVSKHVKKIKGCSVKLMSSSEPYCSIASTGTTSSSLHLKSRTKGTHIFSAGFFTFKSLKQPTLCNQKPSTHNSKEFNPRELSTPSPGIPLFTPATKDPLETSELSNGTVAPQSFFPPIPRIPRLPPFPFRPRSSVVPPNPFQLPPSVLPPTAVQPPPSILPPNPVQPPPSMLPPPSVIPPNPLQSPNPLQPPPSLIPPNPLQSPNPLQPPPSLIPPNPLQPPPSIFPTNQFQRPPSPPSIFPPKHVPPVPGLSPPSPRIPPLSPIKKTYP